MFVQNILKNFRYFKYYFCGHCMLEFKIQNIRKKLRNLRAPRLEDNNKNKTKQTKNNKKCIVYIVYLITYIFSY